MPFSSLETSIKDNDFSSHYPCIHAMKSVATGPLGRTNIVFQIRQAVSTTPVRNEYVKDFYQVRRIADVGILL